MDSTNNAPKSLEVDEQFDLNQDSSIGRSLQTSTISMRSSVSEYVEENGRTYHAYNSGKYIGPNDLPEQERLDLQHHLFVMTMDGRLHLAPVSPEVKNVLDICTGTGIWATEFDPEAQQYPSASVVGTDLSPIQPEIIPANCTFIIDDAEQDWVFSQQFDYIHGRAIISCFRDPPSVVDKIYNSLIPGGYFELQDPIMPLKSMDGSLKNTALDEWQTKCMAAAEKLGRPWTNSKNYGMWMRQQGFVDVVETHYYWATNQWVRGENHKQQAMYLQKNLTEGLAAWGLSTLSRGFGWSKAQIEELLGKARAGLKDTSIHAYAEMYVVYGRKPL